ncbi:hypothetical protein HETIRDRAFT_162491 [Heterobasidion irregulare TC 32-1]|uniref:Uncharacterized protein n=1 Tax=Heterobasidion irregulare (strain TC 32-1) TaxID=747525 RepID=W4JQ88_HETIT|nr:uncharacterized protein HETIRDRAFT_162491 [Heterobasidion irregulare TC 32-1]ETW75727.1 hypothetical protein HETIRDRAFT_162491 [Heterobasidion irregulare TC 32-1]
MTPLNVMQLQFVFFCDGKFSEHQLSLLSSLLHRIFKLCSQSRVLCPSEMYWIYT